MSHIFKVGDRVRIVDASDEFEKFLGKEATIWAKGNLRHWRIDIDGYGRLTPEGEYIGAFSHALEPIQPPKSQIDEILLMQNLPDRDCQKAAA